MFTRILAGITTGLLSLAGLASLSGCASGLITPNPSATGAISTVSTGTTGTTGSTGSTKSSNDSDTTTTQAAVAPIQGSDFGGHAPIVGAHVFVLEPNPSAKGYGRQVKSLLTSASANGSFPTAMDTTAGSPTNGMYYVTSNNAGQFFLSGDYTCDIGYPVYLAAYGGNPLAPAPAQMTLTVTGASAAPDSNGNLLVTFTTSGVNLLYQGEQVVFSNFTGGGAFSGFAGTTQTVSPINLSTNSFSVELGPSSSSVGYQAFSATVTQATASLPSNQAIVNLVLLGVCGDTSPTNPTPTGTANFSNLNFLYMNEVSTAATAYALAGFFTTPTYTFTATLGSLTHNSTTLSTGVQTALGSLTATGSSSGTVTITGATISGSSGNYSVTMSASSPVVNGDSLTFTSSDASGTFGNYANGATLSVTGVSTTSDPLHISVPCTVASGTTCTTPDAQALKGLQNAARNAALLYDIQGGNVGTGSDGDTHIARSVTPNAAAGTVPQSLLNTLGNLLANCVDSANTYGVNNTSGSESPQCATLFNTATSTGASGGVAPYDIATAAINIAHYPGGSGSSNTFASTLFNSVSGNVPFSPSLSTAPHDFAVAITYQTPASAIADIAVDTAGDVWTVGTSSNNVLELSPSGTYTTYTPPTGSTMGTTSSTGVTIDTNGTVFASATLGTIKFTPGTSTGILIGAGNTANGGQIAVDQNDNLYIADDALTGGAFTNYYSLLGINNPLTNSDLVKESASGTAAGGNFPVGPGAPNASQNTAQSCIPAVSYLALDSNNNIWTSTPNNSLNPYATICRFDSAGNFKYSFSLTPNSTTGLPHQIAVDNGNNAWVAEKDQNYLYKIAAGTTTSNAGTTLASGGSLAAPKGVAIDGSNTVWVSNTGNSTGSLVHYSNGATAITPSYLSGTGYGGASYLYLAVDQAANVWAVDNADGILVQYIGVGSPVAQPFSVARAGVGLGARP